VFCQAQAYNEALIRDQGFAPSDWSFTSAVTVDLESDILATMEHKSVAKIAVMTWAASKQFANFFDLWWFS